jgi:Protein of unknown function (DUF2844)
MDACSPLAIRTSCDDPVMARPRECVRKPSLLKLSLLPVLDPRGFLDHPRPLLQVGVRERQRQVNQSGFPAVTNHRWKNLIPNRVAAALRAALVSGLFLATGGVRPASAVLGGGAESVQADQSTLGGERSEVAHPSFTVEVISTPAGVVVNEYVSSAGTVLAVSSRGPRNPDLALLLGPYFPSIRPQQISPPAAGMACACKPGTSRWRLGARAGPLGKSLLAALLPSGAADIQ